MSRRPASVVAAPERSRKWRTRPAPAASDHWSEGWTYPVRLFLPIRKARP